MLKFGFKEALKMEKCISGIDSDEQLRIVYWWYRSVSDNFSISGIDAILWGQLMKKLDKYYIEERDKYYPR